MFPTDSADARLYAPATERNREAIAAVLSDVLPQQGLVLEVASGTGQHITWLAPRFAQHTWQPSDPDPMHLASIESWSLYSNTANLRSPIQLDASTDDWGIDHADVILCINMIHIAPWQVCLGLLRGAAELLPIGGILYLYGPFKRQGEHTSPSNEAFDFSLRSQDASWGVRDLDEVITAAHQHGLLLAQVIPMPANNLSVILHNGHTEPGSTV